MSQSCVRLFRAGFLVFCGALFVAVSVAQPAAEPFDPTEGGQGAATPAVTFTRDIAPPKKKKDNKPAGIKK